MLREAARSPSVPEWWNGRRRGFKIPRRKACRFESDLGYHHVLLNDNHSSLLRKVEYACVIPHKRFPFFRPALVLCVSRRADFAQSLSVGSLLVIIDTFLASVRYV